MNSAVIILIVVAVAVASGVVWFHGRKHKSSLNKLEVPDVGQLVWDRKPDATFDAAVIGSRLRVVKLALWPRYEAIYGKSAGCHHSPIRLDPNHPKVAEIRDIDRERLFYLNPLLNYERGYGAELHNLIRIELFGVKHVYNTIDKVDQAKYDEATALWKVL